MSQKMSQIIYVSVRKKAIVYIKTNKFISVNELVELVGKSQLKIDENIKKLKDLLKLKRVRCAKGGCLQVHNQS